MHANNKIAFIFHCISIIYITLPTTMFIAGWFSVFFSVPACSFIAYVAYRCIRSVSIQSDGPRIGVWVTIVGTSLVVLWVLLSGSGGVFLQNSDYSKHNAILRDLILYDWPVVYPDSSELVYYVGYYLPAAVTGKILGWNAANFVLLLWTVVGVILALFWFMWIIKRFSIIYVVAFICFSGMDYLGRMILTNIPIRNTEHLEWWGGILQQYASNTTLLYWVPQHAISGWLITALLMVHIWELKSSKYIVFFGSLCLIWSPFVAIGLVPFAAYSLYKIPAREHISIPNVAAIVTAIAVSNYLLSGSGVGETRFIWDVYNFPDILPKLLLIYLCEFGFLVYMSRSVLNKHWLVIAAAFMVFVPVVLIGQSNDFGIRSVIPSLFVLSVFVARALSGKYRQVIIICLIVGSLTARNEIYRAFVHDGNTVDDRWHSVYTAEPQYRDQYLKLSKTSN